MREAIPRIEKRLEDLRNFDPNTVTDRSDPRIASLENKLRALLDQVFGTDTSERDRYAYHITELDRAGLNIYGTPLAKVIAGLHEGKASAIQHLQDIIATFEEELEDSGGTPASRALRAYESLELYSEIARAATQLYKNRHYANAIEDAVKL